MRKPAFVLACAGIPLFASALAAFAPQQVKPADCVTIATPPASKTYTYEHRESSGKLTTNTQQWESVTATSSRVHTTGPAGAQTLENTYSIADDVSLISMTVKKNGNGGVIDATAFSPAVVGDPVLRACAGRSWSIPSVTATYRSAAGQNATAQAQGGSLKIVAIREKITVPAGAFDTVHYVRETQSRDEYWKSIDQGVIVKHTAVVMGGGVTETLVSVK
jgi:hypothetical protein